MAVINPKRRKCNVLMSGPIPELGGITGPLYNGNLTNEQIIRLVNNGRTVVEINPQNPSEKQRLTIATCQKSVFSKVDKVEEKPVENTVKRETEIKNLSKKERKRMEWEERQRAEKEASKVEPVNPVVTATEENAVETVE